MCVNILYECQKNQVLPKLPHQNAYYSLQLYINNFTECYACGLEARYLKVLQTLSVSTTSLVIHLCHLTECFAISKNQQ
ncbi:hypothetical protein PR048_008819 [Dryococelus australis]|uniref:Uncharacterized protein n=1 Tax=Dryococelus australis TaxID=614101 RepID=A0ABQ9HY60_9NEOP|nr:hypothetical protein PR048_008819 [Dryococelus australis]